MCVRCFWPKKERGFNFVPSLVGHGRKSLLFCPLKGNPNHRPTALVVALSSPLDLLSLISISHDASSPRRRRHGCQITQHEVSQRLQFEFESVLLHLIS